jgi:succinyl-CoA synthetase beta subunit
LIALGGKLVIDDNALFRQPEIAAIRDVKAEDASTVAARNAGITYIRLNGTIGCVVSGAGLGMATMDALGRHECEASGLLDLGSDLRREKISAALRLLMPESDSVLFNIFADKGSCVEVAHEFMAAVAETLPDVPLVIRLVGWDTEQGQEVLNTARSSRFTHVADMSDAVRLSAAAAKGYTDVSLN